MMTENNTLEGVHLFRKGKEWLYKQHAKKYYWRIPKSLQGETIQEGTVIQGNKKQVVLVTKVFHEEGQEYANMAKILTFKEPPFIREATAEETKQLNRKKKRKSK